MKISRGDPNFTKHFPAISDRTHQTHEFARNPLTRTDYDLGQEIRPVDQESQKQRLMGALMSCLLDEQLLSFSQVARVLPPGRNGRPVAPSTVFRWVRDGVRGIRLEAIRIGGRWLTTREAVARFSAALTAAEAPSTTPTNSCRHRQAEAALDAAGIGRKS